MPVAIPHFDAQNQVQGLPPICLRQGSEAGNPACNRCRCSRHERAYQPLCFFECDACQGPQYLYQHIQDCMVVTAPARDKDHEVVVALWRPSCSVVGSGGNPVHCGSCGLSGPELGKKKLFRPLLNAAAPCKSRGFLYLPWKWNSSANAVLRNSTGKSFPIVWVECSKCPKFYRCDEVGMIKFL